MDTDDKLNFIVLNSCCIIEPWKSNGLGYGESGF